MKTLVILAKTAYARLSLAILLAVLAVMSFSPAALAQNPPPAPAPTPVPPPGSNPTVLAPTDIPPDYSLFWVFMFFLTLCVALIICNFAVRNRTLMDQIDQPADVQADI